MQKQPSLLSQSLYDISVDCTEGTDPFRQSVRYQQFSRQAEKLGLYGSYREEYIRFLRTAYGSFEYGRTDGLSGISYTDAELKEMYGFDESPGRFHEKMLYQQGYDMGRAEREAWGMVAVISIMKELQAIDPKETEEPVAVAPVSKKASQEATMESDFQIDIQLFAKKNKSDNIVKVNQDYLKQQGINPHELKNDFVKKGLAKYDIYLDKNSRELLIYRKGGKGEGISTGIYLEEK